MSDADDAFRATGFLTTYPAVDAHCFYQLVRVESSGLSVLLSSFLTTAVGMDDDISATAVPDLCQGETVEVLRLQDQRLASASDP